MRSVGSTSRVMCFPVRVFTKICINERPDSGHNRQIALKIHWPVRALKSGESNGRMLKLTSPTTSLGSLASFAGSLASFGPDPSLLTQIPTEQTPGQQQINFHLQDVEIVRRKYVPKPDGTLKVHLPNISSVDVEFKRRESVEEFRERLQESLPDFDVSKYYLVCAKGTIDDGKTLDEYFLTPGADVLLVRKGIKNRQQLANRRFWLRSRDCAKRGDPRPQTSTWTGPEIKTHKITPYEAKRPQVKKNKKIRPFGSTLYG